MQLKPVATATPDGKTIIARRYRWIPALVLMEIEYIEQAHRQAMIETVEQKELWEHEMAAAAYFERYGSTGRHPETIGLRKDARLRAKVDFRRTEYSIGDAVSQEKSRSHELKKSLRRRLFREAR